MTITADQARELRKAYKYPEGHTNYEQICILIRQCAEIGHQFITLSKDLFDLEISKKLSDDGFFIYSEDKDTIIVSWIELEEFYNFFIMGQ
jgi:hypothetical protein